MCTHQCQQPPCRLRSGFLGHSLRSWLLHSQVGSIISVGNSVDVRPFQTVHTVPSQGYMVVSTKHKLLPELQGKPPQEIKDRRQAGLAITSSVEVWLTPKAPGVCDTDCVCPFRCVLAEMPSPDVLASASASGTTVTAS